jgi:hypothetical protein
MTTSPQTTPFGGAIAGRYTDAYSLRVDSRGDKLWEKRVEGPEYGRVVGIVCAPDSTCVALCTGLEQRGYLVWLDAR